MEFQRRGVMLVIASPSGAGKSSISRSLFQQDPNIRLSVSVTTRARRSDEVEGTHYYFVDVPTFNRMKAEGGLLESAEVHGNFYGTPRAKVEEQLAAGKDILFDVDYQGTLQLYEKCRADMVTVFILPPTIEELRARLERRAQDSVGTIEKRLRNARIELDHAGEYDYVIINRDLEQSVQNVRSILASARLKRERQLDLTSFVKDLQQQIDSL
ncbi:MULTISPECIES: guanylate kinase [Devosia]|uniref:Guanylate kinase n=1 Tax=Devosia equisanguinis TaxID=2490941 RepID=A0A447IE39_9HYPH|nr:MULTISPECIES: guanylate kinase [Devosia]ODT47109.1 MAG: guanylate kinase [Pelagibacterium sp. SCN 63-126]ODU88925.1 MAG: guanylate kinase [Pelagibacterium sp. SCN 63-17]OJX43180.1 MAG: guanylate kinase [Devosia sp. 63-57]VDS05747.1 Guanylate kinase [Devosia equisanguinis]